MTCTKGIIPVLLLCFLAVSARAQHATKLGGVWQMVSQKLDGKDNPVPGREIKMLTGAHFVWVRQDTQEVSRLLAQRTLRDSLLAYHDAFGAGTYKVAGNTYTETTEFFYEPKYIGQSIDFMFKLDGDRWLISGRFPHLEGGKKVTEILLEEVWKRIE